MAAPPSTMTLAIVSSLVCACHSLSLKLRGLTGKEAATGPSPSPLGPWQVEQSVVQSWSASACASGLMVGSAGAPPSGAASAGACSAWAAGSSGSPSGGGRFGAGGGGGASAGGRGSEAGSDSRLHANRAREASPTTRTRRDLIISTSSVGAYEHRPKRSSSAAGDRVAFAEADLLAQGIDHAEGCRERLIPRRRIPAGRRVDPDRERFRHRPAEGPRPRRAAHRVVRAVAAAAFAPASEGARSARRACAQARD